MSDVYCQKILCKNDVNGNSRSLIVVYGRHTGEPLAILEEGSAGDRIDVLSPAGDQLDQTWLPSVRVAPSEYKAWRKREFSSSGVQVRQK